MKSGFFLGLCLSLGWIDGQAIESTTLGSEDSGGEARMLELALKNQKMNESDICDYTYTTNESFTTHGLFNRVVKHVVTSEAYNTGRRSAGIALVVDGKLISQEKIENQRKRLAPIFASDAASVGPNTNAVSLPEYEITYSRVSFSTYLFQRCMNFKKCGQETIADRTCVVVEFHPDLKGQNSIHGREYYKDLHGRIWIDREALIPVKLRAYHQGKTGDEEEIFAVDYVRIAPHKWAKSYFRLNTTLCPKLFNNVYVDWIFKAYDFKKFTIDGVSITSETPEAVQ
jgi:hypothetical protein